MPFEIVIDAVPGGIVETGPTGRIRRTQKQAVVGHMRSHLTVATRMDGRGEIPRRCGDLDALRRASAAHHVASLRGAGQRIREPQHDQRGEQNGPEVESLHDPSVMTPM